MKQPMQGQYVEDIRVRLTPEQREQLDTIAHERSEPGDKETLSSVVREALSEYLDETHE